VCVLCRVGIVLDDLEIIKGGTGVGHELALTVNFGFPDPQPLAPQNVPPIDPPLAVPVRFRPLQTIYSLTPRCSLRS
jgi:hypothetical protein